MVTIELSSEKTRALENTDVYINLPASQSSDFSDEICGNDNKCDILILSKKCVIISKICIIQGTNVS